MIVEVEGGTRCCRKGERTWADHTRRSKRRESVYAKSNISNSLTVLHELTACGPDGI
jgi:hypothetical protein